MFENYLVAIDATGDRWPEERKRAVLLQCLKKYQGKSLSKTRPQCTAQSNRACFRCGSSSHLANAPNSTAAKLKCKNYGKVGHFARDCHSEEKVQVLDAPEIEVPEIVHVLEVEGKPVCDKVKCSVNIGTEEASPVPIELTVDTGSAVSILPHHLYKQHFSASSLRQ